MGQTYEAEDSTAQAAISIGGRDADGGCILNAMNTLSRYKLAIIYGVIFSVNSLALACTAAFAHVSFKDLAPEDWLVIILAIVGSWTTTMLAFLNKAMHNIPPEQPQPPKS